MYNPEDFDKRQQGEEEPFEHKNDQAAEQEDFVPPIDPSYVSDSMQNGPSWYGVSYPGQGEPVYTDYQDPFARQETPKRKSQRRRKVALIASVVAIAVLLCVLAGFGGAMLFRALSPSPEVPGSDGTASTDDPTLEIGENIFSSSGNEGYDYSSVVISKNDGSGLVGSTMGSAGANGMTKIQAAAAAKDAVVEIMTTVSSNYGSISAGAGSGVIIHSDGIIVTNNHVIEGAQKVYVRLTNGNTYEATVRGTDDDGDIAIIKIDPKEILTVARLGFSGALVEGEEVIAIGNPLGELGGTVTDGIISRVEREVQVDGVSMTLLQTNAAINSGNSGGGLFNMAGELIGVVNAKYSATGVEGLGFAIPIDTAIISINHLLSLGYIPDIPSIGIVLAEGSVQTNTWPFYREVIYVYDAGSNQQFQYRDILLSVDGKSVSTLSELKQIIRAHEVGDQISVVVQRNNKQVNLTVTLVEYVPNSAK